MEMVQYYMIAGKCCELKSLRFLAICKFCASKSVVGVNEFTKVDNKTF